MAFEEVLVAVSRPAGADLSDWATHKFTGVKLNANSEVVKVSAITDTVYGILQSDPKQGEAARVAIGGISKLRLAGTVAAGDQVSLNNAGRGVVAASTSKVIGQAVTGGVTGDIVSVSISTANSPTKV